MADAIAHNLDEIRETLEGCLAAKPGTEEDMEFLTELAASTGRSLESVCIETQEWTRKIKKGVHLVKEAGIKYGFPTNIESFAEGMSLIAEAIDNHWAIFPERLCRLFESLNDLLLEEEIFLCGWGGLWTRGKLLIASIKSNKNLFKIYKESICRLRAAIIGATVNSCVDGQFDNNFNLPSFVANEELRAIAYSMDTLMPGFYAWLGNATIRIGGCTPDDAPYRYPGQIHSRAGIGLVLPGYRRFTTYRGGYDSRRTSNPGAS